MSQLPLFKFSLYVAGDSLNSLQASNNLTALCEAHLPHRYEIEIVDVFRESKQALAAGIRMAPTLVRLSPLPVRRIVGNLSQTLPLLQALGLSEGGTE